MRRYFFRDVAGILLIITGSRNLSCYLSYNEIAMVGSSLTLHFAIVVTVGLLHWEPHSSFLSRTKREKWLCALSLQKIHSLALLCGASHLRFHWATLSRDGRHYLFGINLRDRRMHMHSDVYVQRSFVTADSRARFSEQSLFGDFLRLRKDLYIAHREVLLIPSRKLCLFLEL